MKSRTVAEVRTAQPTTDGAGVAIRRVAGMQHAGMDPILMIDELRSAHRADFAAGFPPHPHRGMQTLTYMKRGGIVHEDNQGNRGEIRGGGAQWMSAGRGIVHSEMPTQDSTGLHGFQIWINLPAEEKMGAPRYRDVPAGELGAVAGQRFRAVAVAGDWRLLAEDGNTVQVAGPLTELAGRAAILDLTLAPGVSLTVVAGAPESLLGYLYDGSMRLGDGGVEAQNLLITGAGEAWTLRAGAGGAGVLLLRGEPLREPVAHYGPFVMNTSREIEQAIADYRSGTFGQA